jgi:hypothetical protein
MVYSQPRNVVIYLNATKSNPRSPQSTTCGNGGRRARVAPLALENTATANHPASTRVTRFAIRIVLFSLPNAWYRRASITRSRKIWLLTLLYCFPIATACKYRVGGERLHLGISVLARGRPLISVCRIVLAPVRRARRRRRQGVSVRTARKSATSIPELRTGG